MYWKKSLLLLSFVTLMSGLWAQDLHFTYFEMSPLSFNPAQAGSFSGSIRLNGHFRGQWLGTGGYRTPAIGIDAPIIKGLRKYDWIGGGISFYRDDAGSGGLITSGGGLNAAYHFGFDKNYSRVFSVGIKYGSHSRKLNEGFNLTLRDELISGAPGADVALIPQVSGTDGVQARSNSDYAIGFLYKAIPNKTTNFEIGLAADHLTSPRTSLLVGAGRQPEPIDPSLPPPMCPDAADPRCSGIPVETDRRNIRFTSHANMTRHLNDKVRFSPGALMQFTRTGFEMQAHAIMGYVLDEKKQTIVNAGLGFRAIGPADAQLFLGAEMKDLKIGAAYDLGLVGFQSGSGLQSAFEIAATYIIKIYKKPEVDPVIFCPRF